MNIITWDLHIVNVSSKLNQYNNVYVEVYFDELYHNRLHTRQVFVF